MSDGVIDRARRQAERRRDERVQKAASELLRGESPDVSPDFLDEAIDAAHAMKLKAAREELRQETAMVLKSGRERLQETATRVDELRSDVRSAVGRLLEAVRAAEEAADHYATATADLRVAAVTAEIDFDDIPAPSISEAELDDVLHRLDARVRSARREVGTGTDPIAPLGALRTALHEGKPDVAVRRLQLVSDRTRDSDLAAALSSDAAEHTVRWRARNRAVELARRRLRRAAQRTARAIAEGRRHRPAEAYPAPVASLLEKVLHTPEEWHGHDGRSLDADVRGAVDRVDAEDACRWVRHRTK